MRRTTIQLVGLFGWRRQHVLSALNLLRDGAPDYFDHLIEHIDEIRYSPRACEGALACTRARHRAVAFIDQGLRFGNVVELAVTLSHESRHYETDDLGDCWFVPHEYDIRAMPWMAQFDPIYREDVELRTSLRWFLAGLRRRRLA